MMMLYRLNAIGTVAVVCLSMSILSAPVAMADSLHFEGFEDPGWIQGGDNWNDFGGGTIQRVTSGTGGIASSSGDAHGQLGAGGGPFTRFGGYRTEFGSGFTASLDIYLDPSSLTNGQGFDYSVALSKPDNTHARDFIWHVGIHNDDLLVNVSHNSPGSFWQGNLTQTTYAEYGTIAEAGWYTFEHVFYEDGDAFVAVDLNLYDSTSSLLFSATLGGDKGNPFDTPIANAGGNRYGWFLYNNIADLAIDNTSLTAPVAAAVPLPAAVWAGLALMGGMGVIRKVRGRRQTA